VRFRGIQRALRLALLRFDQPFEGIHVCQVLRPS
jgi:hypothetical protein